MGAISAMRRTARRPAAHRPDAGRCGVVFMAYRNSLQADALGAELSM